MGNLNTNQINGKTPESGRVKSWINYSTLTNQINESLNISSVDDNATGDYTFNFTNHFANELYVMTQSAAQPSAPNAAAVLGRPTDTAPTVSSRRVTLKQGTVLLDFGSIHAVFHGDLA